MLPFPVPFASTERDVRAPSCFHSLLFWARWKKIHWIVAMLAIRSWYGWAFSDCWVQFRFWEKTNKCFGQICRIMQEVAGWLGNLQHSAGGVYVNFSSGILARKSWWSWLPYIKGQSDFYIRFQLWWHFLPKLPFSSIYSGICDHRELAGPVCDITSRKCLVRCSADQLIMRL